MKVDVVAFAITFVIFVAVDFVWLSSMADVVYKPVLGDILTPEFRVVPAVLFYLIFAAALTFFAVLPSLAPEKGLGTALLNGAIFGLAAYATYDLTNQTTLQNWSTLLTVVDLAWGTFLSALAAGAGHFITMRFVD
jgi:uncharacterized membrane protein